jgi:hypothetical protein
MKPGRAFSLLIGIALLGAIAKFNEMPLDARAPLLGDAAETARASAQLLPSRVAATYNNVTGTAQPRLRFPVAGQGTEDGNAAPPRVAARAEPPSGNPLWAQPLTQLSATRERPVFSPSRRPAPPALAFVDPVAVRPPVKPPEPERPSLALLGTIIGAGDDLMGIFLDTPTKSVLRLRIGEDYQGWAVRLIKPREAALVKDGEQAVMLELPPPGMASAPVRDSRDAMLDLMRKMGAD